MKKITTILIFLASLSFAYSQNDLTTIPQVQQWTDSGEKTPFKHLTIDFSDSLTPAQQSFFNRFIEELRETGLKIKKRASASSLNLVFNPGYNPIENHKNAYEIQFGKNTDISASSYEGMVYATRTLLQIFSQDKYRTSIPNGRIVDYPSYKKRMLLIDVARKFFTIDQIKDFIRAMAWVKMNELHLHLSDNSWGGYSAYRLESKKYPQLTSKDGHYSWDEIRALQDFAHSYGISIVPEIDSPGHSLAFTNIRPDLKSAWLTPNYLDITNKDTYPFMEEILDEVIPHFDAPDFHLGTDEYRIHSIKDDTLKTHIGETFRKYINYFNKVVRKHGKTTRIWSGFEHMPGSTRIDNNITIDMWETSDAKDKSARGYNIINSSHFYTYIVPGAPYYGVNDQFTYEQWTPEVFSNVAEQNLDKNSPGLQGSKMHIWNDFGPTGYSIEEIARLSIPSMMVFSEKMWGTKGYESLADFKKGLNGLMNIPQTAFLDRNFAPETPLYTSKKKVTLQPTTHLELKSKRKNAEYPWKLEIMAKRTAKSTGNEVILSSRLATLYAELTHTFKTKKKKQQVEETKKGIGLVRANQTEGETPITSHRPNIMVFEYELPLNKTVKITMVGEQGKTSLYVNDQFIETQNVQMLCPLEYLGSEKESSFSGKIEQINVVELAPSACTKKAALK